MPLDDPFASDYIPMFVYPWEYGQFGLPDNTKEPDIDFLVQMASTAIDEHCGRQDGDGQGSLVFTTYQQRILAEAIDRNIYYIPHRPLAVVTQETVDALTQLNAVSGAYFYTGCLPAINKLRDGSFSAIISASGRQTYGRRGNARGGNYFGSITGVVQPNGQIGLSNGPSDWSPLDMSNLDYDPKTGEVWFADSSIFYVNYGEVVITYNSGYDPRKIPRMLKMATAAVTKNLMAMGTGTTGMRTFSSNRAGVSAQFDPNIIDSNIQNLLQTFVTTRHY